MRERKYVKFRVDMYDDTKFKIIDRRPERDLIHYIWNRLVVLAGKVNWEGDLYYSKNLPHTIETLAIEFNRGAHEVKLAIDVLLELQMLELTEDKIYRVKNFAKHQNIKPKAKLEAKEDTQDKVVTVNQNEVEEVKNVSSVTSEVVNKEVSENNNNISTDTVSNIPIIFETTKNKKTRRKNKTESSIIFTDEDPEDLSEATLIEGDEAMAIPEGYSVTKTFVF